MQQDKRSIESTDSEDSRLQHTESNVTKYEEIIATPLNAISKDKHEGQQEGMNVAGGYVAVMEYCNTQHLLAQFMMKDQVISACNRKNKSREQ